MSIILLIISYYREKYETESDNKRKRFYFSKLQLFVQSIKRINDLFPDELNSMLKNKYTIIAPNDYSENMEELIFPVKRICRLRQTYGFYLLSCFWNIEDVNHLIPSIMLHQIISQLL